MTNSDKQVKSEIKNWKYDGKGKNYIIFWLRELKEKKEVQWHE